MARGANVVEPKSRQASSNAVRLQQSEDTRVIQIPKESKTPLKELNPYYIHYQSEHAGGSCSYGVRYHVCYRAIELSAKRNLMQEAEILNALRNHTGLPISFRRSLKNGGVVLGDSVSWSEWGKPANA